jgi:DNA repair exonuclease SbcCD nuclease subunit
MSNLFKKAISFTDIHWGLKNNSLAHNQDCDQFVDWVIETAKQEGCETGFFLGDWTHSRASINMQTLQFSIKALEKLNAAFDQFFLIVGNHDLYYRDSRAIHSNEWARHLPNITVCDQWIERDDVLILPWLVGDEHKRLAKARSKYVFGHLELPHFLMNAMVQMPDHGGVKTEEFQRFDSVFSGHFHMRQKRGNVHYIGNAFPHNFSDVGDTQRGAMILEWGEEPEYRSWSDQPVYLANKLSNVIDCADQILRPKAHIKVELDIDISYEEACFIKDKFVGEYGLREMQLIPIKNQHTEDTDLGDIKFESVDKIVLDQISSIESDFYDPKLLLKIYQSIA